MRYATHDALGNIVRIVDTSSPTVFMQPNEVGFVECLDGNDMTHYVVDGAVVPIPVRPSVDHKWNRETHEWTVSIDDVRSRKWAELRSARDEEEFGSFVWGGSVFDSDPVSQQRLIGAALMAQMGSFVSIDWTLADNTVRNLLRAEVVSVGQALAQHIETCHARGRVLREQIQSAPTIEDVNAIHW